MNLEDIRTRIDRLDHELLKILSERMEYALQARKFKSQVEDSTREEQVLKNLKKYTIGIMDADFYEKLFREIIQESKRLQNKEYRLIGFQGKHGAHSEVAAREWNSELIPIPCREFADVFIQVSQSGLDFGIVPVENTLGGVVGDVNDLLIETNLKIFAEIEIPIHHCLLITGETDYREIRDVYSHPQALFQCRNFLERNHLEPVPYYDTAGAARMLSEERPKATAVIASHLCAELYDLEIIKENIEDHEINRTRFLILAREESPQEGNKCSIVFSTAHKAGTLFRVLERFAQENINLTRIESIPDKPGSFAFFLDFQGNKNDEPIQRILKDVEVMTNNYKFLGCYLGRSSQ